MVPSSGRVVVRERTRSGSGNQGEAQRRGPERRDWAPGLVSPSQPAAPPLARSCPRLQVRPPHSPPAEVFNGGPRATFIMQSGFGLHSVGSTVFFKNPFHINMGVSDF